MNLPALHHRLRNWEQAYYNWVRPHYALGYCAPQQFATRWHPQRPTGAFSMKNKVLVPVAAVFAVLIVAGPTFAHHGTTAYEMKDVVTVKGTVTDFEFVNPHHQVYFDVKNEKRETEQWQGELTAPTKLARGWTKPTLKSGELSW